MQSTLMPPAAGATSAGKYLTFIIGAEEFGLAVLKVREIMGIQSITAVPHTPPYLKGVFNLRGKAIPVLDLRLKFGLPALEYTQRTCIIVIEVQTGPNSLLMGIVVDEVCEVVTIVAADIEDAPDFGSSLASPFILGIAKIKDRVKILLNIDAVISNREEALITGIPACATSSA